MWSKNEAIASSLPIDLWPSVNPSLFNVDDEEKFNRSKKAITLYFSGERLSEIKKKTGIQPASVIRNAKKCVVMCWDGQIFGFRALIPYSRNKPNVRTAPFGKKRQHQKGGLTGALSALLTKFPDIEEDLIRRIKQEAKSNEILEYKLSPKSLHKIFIEAIRSKNVLEENWPFNTQYRGLRSIQKYMVQIQNKNFSRSANVSGNSGAKAHTRTGSWQRAASDF